jgi:hypothetical protein
MWAMHPVLERLTPLVGEWMVEASINGQIVARSRTVSEWLEGGLFLVQRSYAEPPLPTTPAGWIENSPFPVTTITGLNDTDESFTQLYADGRGVHRVYQMTFVGDTQMIWRAAPGFHQRFVATVGLTTIAGRWEASEDGTTWTTDFDLTFTRAT